MCIRTGGPDAAYPLQTPAEQEQQKVTLNSQVNYHSEAEMAQYFRDSGVQTILDFGFSKFLPIEEMQALHDYAFETEAAHRDVILGHWVHIDPHRSGAAGVNELRRCIDKRIGFLGLGVSASLSPPASDPLYAPLQALHRSQHSGSDFRRHDWAPGAGLPGGAGVILDDCHPRHLDRVAATYPELEDRRGASGMAMAVSR